MITDSFFAIGKSHQKCDDYALDGDGKIVVCDGCSASQHSDIGSRVLAHSAFSSPWEQVRVNAERAIANIGLDTPTLYSTLLIADTANDTTNVKIVGDGTVVARNVNTKNLEFTNIRFPSGAPFYWIYDDDNSSRDKYIEEFGQEVLINGISHQYFEKYPDGIISLDFSTNDYDLIALFSDGLETFNLPYEEVASELLNFKGYQGQFVKRRARKALESYARRGIFHSDDLGMAVIAQEPIQ